MDLKKIKELIDMLEASSLHKIKIKNGEEEVVLEKGRVDVDQMVIPNRAELTVQASLNEQMTNSNTSNHQDLQSEPEYVTVVAPLVGIYYDANSPESAPFITVGSKVAVGDVLCIIEAMKVLNEIKSPVAGVVKAIHVKAGDILSYNQTLIEIGESVC